MKRGWHFVAIVSTLLTFGQACVHTPPFDSPWDAASAVISVLHRGDFVIQGVIRNADTGDGVPYAEIVLVGTKLPTDYVGGRTRAGMSNRNGVMDQVCSLGWCATLSAEALDIDPSRLAGMDREETMDTLNQIYAAGQRVAVEVRKAGFETQRMEFSLAEISGHEGFTVELGEVVLRPVETASRG